MLLKLAALILGGGTVGISMMGFILMRSQSGEVIFPVHRPNWLGMICWINLTCAILSILGFFQAINPMSLLVAGIAVLSATKFLFFYVTYNDWQKIFIMLWNKRPALAVILGSSFCVGILMLFTAHWIL